MKLPKVSLLTPTRDRRPWLKTWYDGIVRQDYDADRIEIIVLDDGRDEIQDALPPQDPRVHYLRIDTFTPLGTKRNLLAEAATGEILIHIDDDDWQAPSRVSSAVQALTQQEPDVVGRSDLAVWNLNDNTTHISPLVGKKHAWCGTLAYRRSYWSAHPFSYDPANEERQFLRNFDSPLTVLTGPPQQTLVAIAHGGNVRLKTHAFPQTADTIAQWLPPHDIPNYRALESDDW